MGHLKKMNIDIKEIIKSNLDTTKSLLNDLDNIKHVCDLSFNTIAKNGKIILCGNGGSASDSIHISSEMVGKFEKTRKALPAISLSTNVSNLTAIGNDFGFDKIFSRQIEAIGQKGDLLIAISTSGNSINVYNAITVAKKLGLNVIIFTGRDGGKINKFDCPKININSENVARIQECHILIGHIISKYIEENINSLK